ncbi:hypothetical protein [Streptomyces sp. HC307]|uniref:hypothetical protein n=1 Tax=Streptomyces flavusporus TaxID=3385496 RepID=UPI0039172C88
MTGRSLADRRAAAYVLAERLTAEGRRAEVLDGLDAPGSEARRVGMMAEVLARNGIVAIVPHTAESVAAVRIRHEASGTRYIDLSVTERDSPEDSALAGHGLLAGRS